MDSPFVCDLAALDATERERHRDVGQEMHRLVREFRELADGYAFRFSAESSTILLLAEFIALERLCCPFLSLVMEVEGERTLWLKLTGPDGVKPFLHAELGLVHLRQP